MSDAVQHATTLGEWAVALINSPTFIGSLVSATVAGGGFYFAFSQLRHARKQLQQTAERHEEETAWRRSEFVRKLLSDMSNDPKVALIFRILDWRDGPALIPADLKPFFAANPMPDQISPEIMRINWERFVEALPIVKNANWEDADLYTYRTCFDVFLSIIQQTVTDLRSTNIDKKLFGDLTFYCHRIINPKNGQRKFDAHAQDVFKTYILEYYSIETYGYIEECAKYYQDTFIDDLPTEAPGEPAD
ncbi:hypothetical protein [Sphingomonas sanxanigenens]|uniref:Uncharacterized protein n=1 Tax=Sphingomonas sanxanigenens DSM 19645 = NX02 TaxID=1123269 RepID=W0A896_9SPHN|nr:hypothetical protein [Sphingomonas sanxanigenens]AHE53326.1 hypothetical protein NX02_08010 [Sphingomonas sanxanigenens DSM 19645 = NX02]